MAKVVFDQNYLIYAQGNSDDLLKSIEIVRDNYKESFPKFFWQLGHKLSVSYELLRYKYHDIL